MPNWCQNTLSIKGTKEQVEQNDESIKILFDTPWSPSIPVIEKLIVDNPQLEIECEYFEPGMWFAGTITKEGLKELSDEEMEKMYPDWCEPVEE